MNIIEAPIEKEMQSSYIDYAMSVIIGRALPDARDGLKPAQRRILYAMYKLGNFHNQPTKKSARIVGETIGKYHPHGDVAVYETAVRMAQDFSMNYTLIEGQGNMGSIDGDPPAAQRYTEMRLNKISEEMLDDIEKNAVPFVPNFDNTEKEPVVLPSKIPNLIINGSYGIAVGVATNILPHNLGEVCDAIIAYIGNRNVSNDELLQYVKGPDFPTGGTVFYNDALIASYKTGRGIAVIRGKVELEESKGRKLIITEIPYTVNKAMLVEEIANLARSKQINISDLRDESGKEGIRIAIDLKQDSDPEIIKNMLYKHTKLQVSLPIINIAVIGNNLITLDLRQFIKVFVDHRKEVIINRTKYDLEIASSRLHIVEGLLKAVADIDKAISIIKKSEDVKSARQGLIEAFELSEKQANAILDMKLSKLTVLEMNSLLSEKKELEESISNFNRILGSEETVYEIIAKETAEVKSKYSRERRTRIELSNEYEPSIEKIIPNEEATIILTNSNYIKRTPATLYREQGRGGKGIISISLKEGDFVKQTLSCMLKDYLLLLSNKGKAYWMHAYEVPLGDRYSQGKAIVNMLKLSEGERIEKIVNTALFADSFITFLTRRGIVKRVSAEKFSHPRSTGIKFITMVNDELADACISSGKSELFIATRNGKSLRFKESDIRLMGRTARGVRGIRLSQNDSAVNILQIDKDDLIATVTENGFGKVTEASRYRLQRRGGKGVLNIKASEKTGKVVKALKVNDSNKIFIISSSGISITISASDIRKTGRSASGVRLMRLEGGTKVVDVQVLLENPTNNSGETTAMEDADSKKDEGQRQ
ncbi:MAG: DNA gyrase subunit A [Candidatus Micrarchaeia archaeon]